MVIFSNQAGVEKNHTKPDDIKKKLEDIIREVDIPIIVSLATKNQCMDNLHCQGHRYGYYCYHLCLICLNFPRERNNPYLMISFGQVLKTR